MIVLMAWVVWDCIVVRLFQSVSYIRFISLFLFYLSHLCIVLDLCLDRTQPCVLRSRLSGWRTLCQVTPPALSQATWEDRRGGVGTIAVSLFRFFLSSGSFCSRHCCGRPHMSAPLFLLALSLVYRGCACMILAGWMWGVNLWVWNKYRINYLYLLELDSRTTMRHSQVFRCRRLSFLGFCVCVCVCAIDGMAE